MMTRNWPSREEWARLPREYAPLPEAARATQPSVPGGNVTDFASPAEIWSMIEALRQKWCELGRSMKVAGKHTSDGIALRVQRHEINTAIAGLQDGTQMFPLFLRPEDNPAIPLLEEIEAR